MPFCVITFRYFISFAESVQMKGQVVTDSAVLQQCIPDFLWLLRDLDVDKDDEDVKKEPSPTEYIRNSVLKGKKTNLSTEENTGEKILNLFPSLQCLAVSSPNEQIPNTAVHNDKLCDFNIDINVALEYVMSHMKAKTVHSGNVFVTGTSLAYLAEEYIKALSSPDTFPDLEYSWMAVVEKQLQDSLEALDVEYRCRMSETIRNKLPMEQASLVALHQGVLESLQQLLIEKLQSLLPHTNVTTLKLCEKFSMKLTSFLAIFSQDGKSIESGELMKFATDNKKQSHEQCRHLAQKLKFSGQNLINIISTYNKEGIGPAKHEVYEEEIAIIPGKPVDARVVNETSDTLTLVWKTPQIHPSVVQKYCIQHHTDTSNSMWSQSISTTKLTIEIKNLKPNSTYRFRICSTGSLERSEYELVSAKTSPDRPAKPHAVMSFEATDCHKGVIVFKTPKEEDGNGAVVTAIIVQLALISSGDVCQIEKLDISLTDVDNQYAKREINFPNIDQDIHLRISWKNSVGLSLSSDPLVIEATEFIPGPPSEPEKVGRTENKIKIMFDPPEINPTAVDHYRIEIDKESKGSKILVKKTKKLYAVLYGLASNTEYMIYVASVNKKNKTCKDASHLICRTKLSTVTTGSAGVGAAAAPVAGATIVPLASAAAKVDGIEGGKAGKIVSGTIGLLSTPITAPLGFLGGLSTSPPGGRGGAVAAKLVFMDSDDDLEDSDLETDYNEEVQNKPSLHKSSTGSIGSLFSEDFNKLENEPSSSMESLISDGYTVIEKSECGTSVYGTADSSLKIEKKHKHTKKTKLGESVGTTDDSSLKTKKRSKHTKKARKESGTSSSSTVDSSLKRKKGQKCTKKSLRNLTINFQQREAESCL